MDGGIRALHHQYVPKGRLSEGFLLRSATILHGSPMGLCPVGFVDLAAMVCGVDETKAAALLASP
jgi:hypothetical protein